MKIGHWVLALTLTAGQAFCGEIVELGGFDAECSYKFTGKVATGDAAKIDALNTYGSAGASLCLDSPGGSLLEGIAMFNAIWNSQMHTRVVDGDRCESACAIAWLGGGVQEGTLAVRFPSRSIEPGGILGFHAPSLNLPAGGSYPAGDVENAFRIALTAAEGYFDIKLTTDDNVEALNDFLYARILETPGESMFRIQSLAEALMANVAVSAAKAPEKILKTNLVHLCENAYLVHRGVDVALSDAAAHLKKLRDAAEPGERVGYVDETSWVIRMDGERRSQHVCVISDSTFGFFLERAKRYNAGGLYPNGRADFPTISLSLQKVDVWPGEPAQKVWDAVSDEMILTRDSIEMPHYAFYDGLTRLTDLPPH
ncbi:hypothetical protein [Antarctobacter heliothermus]|uniref:Uncharacterized protein n=1 Tax=Antarctobacter heliothermus TaxID=74033 RepID=A0A239DKX9_9RHOB|nr:hypothetical protein [Antarctobacter heliothermus]SNS32859.1 hypothetical protein SAMN04488078_101128 [Antarctobacter heliothermus]